MNRIFGLDLSNYQAETTTPQGLQALISSLPQTSQPEHLVIRAGLMCERPALRTIAAQQLTAAATLGIETSLYAWAYKDYDPAQTVQDAISLANLVSITPSVLWFDLEDVNPSPDSDWLLGAIAECQRLAIPYYGVYTGAWWWYSHMNAEMAFQDVWLWDALYDGSPELCDPSEPSYGGMHLVGHQYTSKPYDMDVFMPLWRNNGA